MNISNNVFSFLNLNDIQNLNKWKISEINLIQNKVVYIAGIVLLFIGVLFSILGHSGKKQTKIENPPPVKLDEKTASVEIKVQRSVAEKLQRNRECAQSQEEAENRLSDKNFHLAKGKIPAYIEIDSQKKPLLAKWKKSGEMIVGWAACEGMRQTMEDTHIAHFGVYFPLEGGGTHFFYNLFGVFDGHGGKDASVFVQKNINQILSDHLKNQLELTDEGIFFALKQTFKDLDENYYGNAGSTATIALILNGKIWVANAGDSRTILVQEGRCAIQASEDAKPDMERYYKKIAKNGGEVFNGRINGILSVARAIGDKSLVAPETGKSVVSPHPKITSYSLDEFKEGYIVLACDGLWDVATTQQVGDAIKKMENKAQSVDEMSRRLVYTAIEGCGSEDNLTVMVVKLE